MKERRAEGERFVVGVGLSLSGDITACETLVVEGSLEGEITGTKHLIVARGGKFISSGEFETADIAGYVKGNLNIKGTLTLRSTGRIKCDFLHYNSIIKEEGAVVEQSYFDAIAPNLRSSLARKKIELLLEELSGVDLSKFDNFPLFLHDMRDKCDAVVSTIYPLGDEKEIFFRRVGSLFEFADRNIRTFEDRDQAVKDIKFRIEMLSTSLRLLKNEIEKNTNIKHDISEIEVTFASGTTNLAKREMKKDHIFVVHGHDLIMKESVARTVEKLKMTAIILNEQVDGGQTVIEKFLEHAERIGFAIVLMSPDDKVESGDNKLLGRARQNVIFELGYFIAKLGRGRVCIICSNNVEMLSDLSGVIYIKFDHEGIWKFKLAREMKQAGLDINFDEINF
jgi:predicted nucleotide-binding protein/cytoskeletal protein CcmA (bactofilin family)